MSPAATVAAQWQRAAFVSRAHSASALYTADTRPPLALIAQLNQRHLHSPWHCAFCLLLPSLSIHQVLHQRSMWIFGSAPLSANVSMATERRSKASWVDRTEKGRRGSERQSGTTTTKGGQWALSSGPRAAPLLQKKP